MALINCKECNKEISTKANICPNCGAKVNTSPSGCFITVVGLIGLLIFLSIIFAPKNKAINTNQVIVDKQPTLKQSTSPQKNEWIYSHDIDPMSEKPTFIARVISENTIDLDFPYKGEQHARLTARTHPRWGKSLLIQIERGQFLCHSYNDCNLTVKFDDRPPITFSGSPPEDNSTETVFIDNYSRFMGMVLKSKTVKISMPIYQSGNPIFEFNIEGFDVNKYKPYS